MTPIAVLRIKAASGGGGGGGGGGSPITVGDLTTTGDMGLSNDIFQGTCFQAAASGTVNFMTILGRSGASTAVNYRLVIYDATSATVISGSKLGETAATNGLGVSESKKIALLAPVTIVSGNWYALGIQPETTMSCAKNAANNGRFFFDSYSDGALATAPASSSNDTAAPSITASTS